MPIPIQTSAQQCLAEIQAAGYRYQGELPAFVRSQLWLEVICAVCEAPRKISLNSLRSGVVCNHRKSIAHRAETKMAYELGFETQELPKSGSAHWSLRCFTCGTAHRIRGSTVRDGTAKCPCHEGLAYMRRAGYEPKVPYPGRAARPWPSICTTCGAACNPCLAAVHSGQRCKHSGTAFHAVGQNL